MKKPFDWFNWNVSWLVIVAFLVGLFPLPGLAQTIVWTDENGRRIQSKDVNGGPVQTIVQFQSPQSASEIHYDPIASKLYFLSGSFWRINMDGSNPEKIVTPSAGKFALGVESRWLYWSVGLDNVLHYSQLDGSGGGSHTYANCCLLCLEAVGDDLFFGAGGMMQKGIWRADGEGANEQFLTVTPQPADLAYDPQEDKIYVATLDHILRVSADGSDPVAQLVQQLDAPADHVVLDVLSRKVYWASRQVKVIRRSNLDGTAVEDFVTANDVGNPSFDIRGLTIVASPRVPALSKWGLAKLILFMLTAGVIMQRKRHDAAE